MSRTIELIAGVLLLIVGVLLLASEPLADLVSGIGIDNDVLRWWPILIIGLSLFFLVPALVGGPNRRLRAGMVIPGALLAGIGSALLYTSLTDRWSAWAYLWSVFPFSLGLGMYAAGWIADAPAFKWIGSGPRHRRRRGLPRLRHHLRRRGVPARGRHRHPGAGPGADGRRPRGAAQPQVARLTSGYISPS